MSQSAKDESAAVPGHLHSAHTHARTHDPSTCSWLLIELFLSQGTFLNEGHVCLPH